MKTTPLLIALLLSTCALTLASAPASACPAAPCGDQDPPDEGGEDPADPEDPQDPDAPEADEPEADEPEADAPSDPEGEEQAEPAEGDPEDEIIVLDDPEEEEDPVVEEPEERDESELGPIIVTATPEELARMGGSASNVGEDELKEFEFDDAHSILLRVPGLYVRQEDAFGLRPNIGLRGANSDRSKKVTLMEDGILLAPAPYAAPAAYYFPMMTRMVNVEVFKGPAAVRFGPNTIGGAINFVSRDIPFEPEGSVDLALGLFAASLTPSGKAHLYYGDSAPWGGFLIEGVHLQSEGFKELDSGGPTGFSKSEITALGQINSDLSAETFHRLRLRLGFAREISRETYLGLSDADFKANPYRRYAASERDRMEWLRTQLQLQYRMDVGDDFDLTAALYRHDFDRAWRKLNSFQEGPSLEEILDDPTSGQRRLFYDVLTGQQDSSSPGEALQIGTNARTFVSEGAQAEAHKVHATKTWSTELRLGLRLHHDQIEREHTEQSFLMEAGALVDAGLPSLSLTRNRASAVALAAYLTDVTTLGRLSLAPGLRMEVIQTELFDRKTQSRDTHFQQVFLPGFGVHYALTPELGALAGVHRGFSPVAPGQPDAVEPEISLNYEAGLRYDDPKADIHAELIGFFNDYTNLTGECSFSAGCDESQIDLQFNAGEVRVLGLESMLSSHLDIGKSGLSIPARLAYTLTLANFETSFTSDNPQFGEVKAGDALPYLPVHQLSVTTGLDASDWGLAISAVLVDEMHESAYQDGDGDDKVTDRFVMVDLSAHWDFFEDSQFYFKVDNALNAQPIVARLPFGARPAKPLLFQIGARTTF